MKHSAKALLAIFTLLGLASSSLYAAAPGAYVGAGIGASKQEMGSKTTFTSGTTFTRTNSGVGLAGRLFAGYNLNENLGIEAAYAHYYTTSYKVSNVPFTTGNASYNLDAGSLVAKLYLPISTTGVNLYGLGGVALVHSNLEYKTTTPGAVTSSAGVQNKLRPTYGLGVSYDVPNSKVVSNLEYSRIQGLGNTNTSTKAIPNADLVTFNIGYKFD